MMNLETININLSGYLAIFCSLILRCANITDDGTKIVRDYIKDNKSIKYLFLNYHQYPYFDYQVYD